MGIVTGSTTSSGKPLPRHSLDLLVAGEETRRAFRLLDRELRWIDEQHLEICRIPAPTFQERARAEWFLRQFESFGLDSRLDRAGNVVALPKFAPKNAPLVALTAHLDTVLAPTQECDIRQEGKRLLGPGVSDNGAGLAALLAMARVFAEYSPSDGQSAYPLFVANVGEEGEGNLSGMRFLCRSSTLFERIRAFLVLDGPSVDHVTSEALACRRFEISMSGPGGHSWSDHGIVNPVNALARMICGFGDRVAEAFDDNRHRYSFNFGVIDGGSTVNAIPTWARAKLDLRSPQPETLEELVRMATEAVEKAAARENDSAAGGRIAAKIKETGFRPGGSLDASSPLLEHLRAVDRFLGIQSRPDCASTDANVPLSLGLQAVSIGSGGSGGGAHTPQEWYSSEGRVLGLRRIYLAVRLLMAGEAPDAAK